MQWKRKRGKEAATGHTAPRQDSRHQQRDTCNSQEAVQARKNRNASPAAMTSYLLPCSCRSLA